MVSDGLIFDRMVIMMMRDRECKKGMIENETRRECFRKPRKRKKEKVCILLCLFCFVFHFMTPIPPNCQVRDAYKKLHSGPLDHDMASSVPPSTMRISAGDSYGHSPSSDAICSKICFGAKNRSRPRATLI